MPRRGTDLLLRELQIPSADPLPIQPLPNHSDEPRLQQRLINYRLVIATVIVSVVLIVGMVVVHGIQLSRTASLNLERAKQARADGEPDEAVTHLRRYLGLFPDDNRVRAELGLLLADSAETSRQRLQAFMVLESVLRSDPSLHKVRRQLVDLSLDLRRYSDAIVHLQTLSEEFADDAEIHSQLGRSLEGSRQFKPAAEAYERAIQADPLRFEDYERLAFLWQWRLKREKEAERLMDLLVGQNKRSFEAFLARYRYFRSQGDVDSALLDARSAYRLAPVARNVLVAVGEIIASLGSQAAAQAGFNSQQIQTGLEQLDNEDRGNVEVVAVLAELAVRSGRLDLALERLEFGLEKHPENVNLRWKQILLLISGDRLPEAIEKFDDFLVMNPPREYVGFLEALLSIADEDWVAASRKLETVRSRLIGGELLTSRVELRLGQCYRELRHILREETAYRQALKLNPSSAEARYGLAAVLAKMGRFEDALSHYKRISHVPGALIEVARLFIEINLRLKPAERKWDEVDQVLNRISKNDGNLIDVLMIRADMLVIQNQMDQAQALLERASQRDPGEVRLWVVRANLHLRKADRAAAKQVLDKAEQTLGKRSELFLARMQYWASGDAEDAVKVIGELESQRKDYPESAQESILSGLALAYAQAGDTKNSERLLTQLAQQSPQDLLVRRRLLRLALGRGDVKRAQELIANIRSIEGTDGVYWRLAQASLDVARARRGELNYLAEARELTLEARELLTNSPRVAVLLGQIDLLSGDEESAAANFWYAVDLGERSVRVFRDLISLLTRQGRYGEAEDVLRKFEEQQELPLSQAFGKLAVAVSMQTKNFQRALQLAQRSVDSDPKNLGKQLWLGRVQLAAGNLKVAEKAFQTALDMDRTHPAAWVAWVSFLAKQERSDEADAAIKELKQHVAAEVMSLTMALCYEAVGNLELAEREYRTALAAGPRQSGVSWKMVEFYLRDGQLKEAETLLEKLVDPQSRTPKRILLPARRVLSTLLVLRGHYPEYQQALALIDANLESAPSNNLDLLARAKLLQTRPLRRLRLEAIRIMESFERRSKLSEQDQFDLARLHVAVGNWRRARQTMMVLLLKQLKNPQWLAFSVRNSIDHGELDGACSDWLEQLTKLEPKSVRALELRMRYLTARGETDDAIAQLTQWIVRPDGVELQTGELRTVATLLLSLSEILERSGQTVGSERMSTEAERYFQKLVESEPKEMSALVHFYLRRGNIKESLRWCEQAWQSAAAKDVGRVCVDLLRSRRLSPVQDRLVFGWIERARRQHPDQPELLIQHANAALLTGNYSQAESLYRDVIRNSPDAFLAYNDLALLITFRGGNATEALQLVEKAIELSGPLTFLLDSRASVYLALGEPDNALKDLERAIADDPTPDKYFHFAQAQLALRNTAEAKSAFQKAVQAKLHLGILHPLEASAYHEVSAAVRQDRSRKRSSRP